MKNNRYVRPYYTDAKLLGLKSRAEQELAELRADAMQYRRKAFTNEGVLKKSWMTMLHGTERRIANVAADLKNIELALAAR